MENKANEKKQLNIGVMIGSIHSYYPTELIQGIYQASKDYDVNVMFFLGAHEKRNNEVEEYDYQVNTVYDYTQISGVDALIISYGTIGQFLEEQEKEEFLDKFSNMPHFVLEEEAERNYIISDNYNGMKAVVEHLVKVRKYRMIAYISGPDGNLDAVQRRQAYMDVMNENLLPIRKGYIEKGDFTKNSGVVIDKILDKYPDIQAVVCANDEMAFGAYERCVARGLKVGDDIVITGYDNCTLTQNIDLPLAKVNQNGYDMGYRAVKEVIKLCEGGERIEVSQQKEVDFRDSCGCQAKRKEEKVKPFSDEYNLSDIDNVVEEIVGRCVLNYENEVLLAYAKQHIKELIEFTVQIFHDEKGLEHGEFDKGYLSHLMRRIVSGRYEQIISSKSLLEELNKIFLGYISTCEEAEKKIKLLTIYSTIQECVNANLLRRNEEELMQYKQISAIGSFFERKLMEYIYDEKQVYFSCVKYLKQIGVKGAFICVHKEPVIYRKYDIWKCPKEIYIAAMYSKDTLIAFGENDRMVVNEKKGIMNVLGDKGGLRYMLFPLFAGEYQYGILVCEVEPSDLSSVYLYSLTLGSVLRFMQLSKQERVIQKKLEDSMRLLQEKNKVLGFISAYDELTGMLNRRGFGEKAFEFTKKYYRGKTYLIFADLDHLKEINDKFGHAEGDYAITQCARVLNSQCGENDITGRMGGDEFMMMIASEEENFEEKFKKSVKKAFEELNATSNKPFYVEASIGIKPFVGDSEFELSTVLQQADKLMYESKKLRRETISRVG